MKRGATQKVRRLFEHLRAGFETRGWKATEPRDDCLRMARDDATDIEQVLWVIQPLGQREMPFAGVTGLACSVRLFYRELEPILVAAAGQVPASTLASAVDISLQQLIGPEKFYLGNVYLVEKDIEEGRQSLAQILDDYDDFLEPLLRKLCNPACLLDESFTPQRRGGPIHWTWEALRAAYYKAHVEAAVRDRLFERLGALSQAIVAREANTGLREGGIITDIETLVRGTELRAAKKMLRLLEGLRRSRS
jgi:hypothetical protein